MKILLLAGTGVMGASLLEILDSEIQIVVTTRNSEYVTYDNVEYVVGDGHNIEFLQGILCEQYDVIVDFLMHSTDEFRKVIDILLGATSQYIYLSSCRVFEESSEPITETSPRLLDASSDIRYLNTNEYALEKARQEDILRSLKQNNWTIVRPYITYGPNRLQLGCYEIVNWLIPLLNGIRINVPHEILGRTTTMTDGRDVAKMIAGLMGKTEALGEDYNLTTNETIQWKEVMNVYAEVLTNHNYIAPEPCVGAMRESDKTYQYYYDRAYNRKFNNSKIVDLLGDELDFIKVQDGLEECLQEFISKEQFCGCEEHVRRLIQLLKEHGIRKVIVCPETLYTDFVVNIARDSFFELYYLQDERSAAYVACGMAEESNEVIALTCIGNSVSSNHISALTEAYCRKLSILDIVFTSSQDGNRQNIVQQVEWSRIVRLSVAIYPIHSSEDRWERQIIMNKALLELKYEGGGPVHIELISDINKKLKVKDLPNLKVVNRYMRGRLPNISSGPVAIYVGVHRKWSQELTGQVELFCKKYNGVVFGNHASNYKGDYFINASLLFAQKDKKITTNTSFNAELVITIGDISDAPYKIPSKEVWGVNLDGELRDEFHYLRNVFQMEEIEFFAKYNLMAKHLKDSDMTYYEGCNYMCQSLVENMPMIPFSNVWIARETISRLPEYSVLKFDGLKLSRSWNLFPLHKSICSYVNTGGFEIEGCVSSLIGSSLVNKNKIYYGIVNEKTFINDMNSLGDYQIGANIRILIIVIRGESRYFGAELTRDKSKELINQYVTDYDFLYLSATSQEEYNANLEQFVNPVIGEQPILFEVFIDEALEHQAFSRISNIMNS